MLSVYQLYKILRFVDHDTEFIFRKEIRKHKKVVALAFKKTHIHTSKGRVFAVIWLTELGVEQQR